MRSLIAIGFVAFQCIDRICRLVVVIVDPVRQVVVVFIFIDVLIVVVVITTPCGVVVMVSVVDY